MAEWEDVQLETKTLLSLGELKETCGLMRAKIYTLVLPLNTKCQREGKNNYDMHVCLRNLITAGVIVNHLLTCSGGGTSEITCIDDSNTW